MRFGPIPLDEAEGKILGHNIAGPDGRRILRKGRPLLAEDVAALRALGRSTVYAATLDDGDVDENTAARRLAEAITGAGLRLSGPASGRMNLLTTVQGVLRVDAERLGRINELGGITIASLSAHTPLPPRKMAATVKVIPFAVPEANLRAAEEIAASGPLIRVDELPRRAVGLILSGSPSLKERLTADFQPLGERIEALGSRMDFFDYVPLDGDDGERLLGEALLRQRAAGADLIILAGETAIMDRCDIQPRAVDGIGGQVESVGAPVDPGNLLMLAYLEGVPILGAPGCARSRKTNVVDWILPRLLVGERLKRADIVALGHGGLLEDVPERPAPRAPANPTE